MIATRPQRNFADSTRRKILDAARDLFVEQGFSATSISQIAKAAGIHQSLMYHHFGNKTQLWCMVKEYLLKDHLDEIGSLFMAGLPGEMFIDGYVSKRLHTAVNHQAIQRMVQWQRLEANPALEGLSEASRTQWVAAIAKLQSQSQLRSDITAEELFALLNGTVTGFIENYASFLKPGDEEALHRCSRILTDMLKAGLTYQSFLLRRGPA